MSKKLIATYEMLQQYQYSPSNSWLALGEFIDNSISSYQGKNRNNPIDNLLISIIFDDTEGGNEKIIISDNANGMSAKELEEAMQPYNRTGKKDTDYNQYGVGMKLGIFWHGANATIYSKKNGMDESKLVLNTEGIHSSLEEVVVESVKSNDKAIKYPSGTTIIISKVYENKSPINNKGRLDKIFNALGWRYSKLLKKGLMIRIDIKSMDKNKCQSIVIKPFEIKPFVRNELFYGKNESNETNDQKITTYEQRLEKLYNELCAGKHKDKPLLLEAYEKVNKNEPVILEKDIYVNGQWTRLKFGILSLNIKKKLSYSGVTVYHRDRAIMHGPNDTKVLNSGTFQFLSKAIGSGGGGESQQLRYLFGELDLTGIENPDQNKSRFIWSINGQEDIEKELEKIFEQLKPLLDVITKVVDIKTNKEMTKKQAKEAKEIASEKLPLMDDLSISKNDLGEISWTGKFNFFGSKYDLEIYESWKESISFIEVDHDEHNKKLTIKIEAENKFWKPLVVSNEDFKGELLYPLAALIGLTELLYKNDDLLRRKNWQGKSYSELINIILEQYKS